MIKDNRKLQLFVNKEIIVSGGSVGSPTLLMLSGVGPKEHLTKIKVYLLILLGIF
jgi:choline dehydrogenase-like flavoprotein